MKRSSFLKQSLLGTAGIVLFPWEVLAAKASVSGLRKIDLPKVVPQPRHGNFCSEGFSIDEKLSLFSRDRLLHDGMKSSETDLLSVNLLFKERNLNITVSPEECWYNAENDYRRIALRGSISSLATDIQIVHGYANIEKCSLNSKLYILPLAGQFKLDGELYNQDDCIVAQGLNKMSIETSKSSRILLLTL